ncbi:MAG: DNA starvation/stationary phase protection protein [Clostridia bacterium]|nr:DNA starvation/stationary phase protection protein [Clostridia bacterium]
MENMVTSLNSFLADLNVFYRKLQNYHWNVYGKDFFVVHAKLEEYYDEVNKQIDEIAEHILMLGSQPLGTMQDYLNRTCIVEAKNEKIALCNVFENLIKDFETLLKKVTEIKKEADEQKQYATSALMDEYISNYMKTLWMLSQSIEK